MAVLALGIAYAPLDADPHAQPPRARMGCPCSPSRSALARARRRCKMLFSPCMSVLALGIAYAPVDADPHARPPRAHMGCSCSPSRSALARARRRCKMLFSPCSVHAAVLALGIAYAPVDADPHARPPRAHMGCPCSPSRSALARARRRCKMLFRACPWLLRSAFRCPWACSCVCAPV